MSKNKQLIRLTEAQLNDFIKKSVKLVINEIMLGPNDRFTPYTPEERERNFSALFSPDAGDAYQRNPSYEKAKKEAQERLRRRKLGLTE